MFLCFLGGLFFRTVLWELLFFFIGTACYDRAPHFASTVLSQALMKRAVFLLQVHLLVGKPLKSQNCGVVLHSVTPQGVNFQVFA